MTSLRDWKNSLRCNEKLSPKSKSRTAFSCSEKNLVRNSAKPSGNQHAYDRFEVKKKSNTMLRIKNCNDIAADAVGTTTTVALTGSDSPIARPRDCPEEESHELDISQDYSTYLKAFALIYVLPEEEWKAENIDKLLVEGEELFQASSATEVTDGLRKALSSIYTSVEQRIKRSFKLEGHSFTLELRPSYLGDSSKPADLRPPHIMKHLREVLRAFFRKAHYCLLQHKAGCLLIWRRRNLYFMMDVKGRRPDDLANARPHVAMLICLKTLDNVFHLASNLSGDDPNNAFNIRELAVVRLVTPDGRTFLRDTNQRALEYHVINNSYAFLKSNLHLSLNPEATLHNGSSVILGVASIIAAQIDHPASWNTYTFDRLICYGVELCRSCWCANVRNRLPINLCKFPTQLRLGQFVAEIKLLPQIGRGRWRCGLSTQGNAFDYEIRRVLRDYGNALFQISNQIYAMWCKDNFYYLLDPYRHIVVSPQATKNAMKLEKWATVRMFRDLCGMLNVFHQLLKESNRHAPFYLHVVRIKNIAKCPHGYALKPKAEDAYCELKPINEPIDFPQQLGKCARQLAEISDFEPDVISTTEDATELENLKLVPGPERAIEPAEEVGLEKVQVEVETIKPAGFRRDIDNEKTNFDKKGGGVANTKANFQTQMSKKPKMAILAAAASLKPPKVPPSTKPPRNEGGLDQLVAPVARRMAPRMKRKGFQADTVSTLAKKVKSRASQEQEQEQQVMADKFSKLDAKMCAKYLPLRLSKLKRSDCSQCDESKCKESDNSQSTKPNSEVSGQSATIQYPVYTKYPFNLTVAGSESGTVESLNRLLDSAFKVTNRVLAITPWGNYVVFKHATNQMLESTMFYVFDGCTCNIDRFRHLDLSHGTAGLLAFQSQSEVVCYMIDSRETRALKSLHVQMDQTTTKCETFPCRGT